MSKRPDPKDFGDYGWRRQEIRSVCYGSRLNYELHLNAKKPPTLKTYLSLRNNNYKSRGITVDALRAEISCSILP